MVSQHRRECVSKWGVCVHVHAHILSNTNALADTDTKQIHTQTQNIKIHRHTQKLKETQEVTRYCSGWTMEQVDSEHAVERITLPHLLPPLV